MSDVIIEYELPRIIGWWYTYSTRSPTPKVLSSTPFCNTFVPSKYTPQSTLTGYDSLASRFIYHLRFGRFFPCPTSVIHVTGSTTFNTIFFLHTWIFRPLARTQSHFQSASHPSWSYQHKAIICAQSWFVKYSTSIFCEECMPSSDGNIARVSSQIYKTRKTCASQWLSGKGLVGRSKQRGVVETSLSLRVTVYLIRMRLFFV